MNNIVFKNIYPKQIWTNENYRVITPVNNNERFFGGAFLLPFLTGAAVTAPLWFVAGNNKAQSQYNQQMYYNQQYNQPYPMYYPYQSANQQYPYYYPYPPYK